MELDGLRQLTELTADADLEDAMPAVADSLYQLGAERGFAGLKTDYDARAIHLYWAGALPDDVSRLVESDPLGVKVTVTTSSNYSRSALEAARSDLLASELATSLDIISVSVPFDGHALVVGTTREEPFSQGELESLRRIVGGTEVDVEYEVPQPVGFASRENDDDPWKGGIRLRIVKASGNVGRCTAGFAVIKDGTGRLLSARHCNPAGNAAIEDGANQQIAPGGSSVDEKKVIDSLLIDPTASPATKARIYRGGYNSSTKSDVKGWDSNWPGDPVCLSAATSGEHCGTVYDDNDTVLEDGVYVPVIQASAASGLIAGEGDSGGPVFRTVSAGVRARGILWGPDPLKATTYCTGGDPAIPAPWRCSQYMSYVPISVILNNWTASLETM